MRTQRGRFGERGALPVHHQRPQQHGHGQQAAQHQRAHVAHCGEAAGGPVLPQKESQAPPRGHQVGSGYGAASPGQGTVPQFPSSASRQYKDTLGGQGCLSPAGCSEAGEQGESKMGAGDVPGEPGGQESRGGEEERGSVTPESHKKALAEAPCQPPAPCPGLSIIRCPLGSGGTRGHLLDSSTYQSLPEEQHLQRGGFGRQQLLGEPWHGTRSVHPPSTSAQPRLGQGQLGCAPSFVVPVLLQHNNLLHHHLLPRAAWA